MNDTITVRDLFAAAALAGILAEAWHPEMGVTPGRELDATVELAFMYADAMLNTRDT